MSKNIDTATDGTEQSIVDREGLDEPSFTQSWTCDNPKADGPFVCGVAEALEAGDEVIINDRSRPLEVLGFEEQRCRGFLGANDYPYHILWLRGNGTEYRLRWSHLCEYLPRLHTESQLETRESFCHRDREKYIQTTAKTSGTRVRWICPVDVDKSELSDWVLARSIRSIDTDIEQSGE